MTPDKYYIKCRMDISQTTRIDTIKEFINGGPRFVSKEIVVPSKSWGMIVPVEFDYEEYQFYLYERNGTQFLAEKVRMNDRFIKEIGNVVRDYIIKHRIIPDITFSFYMDPEDQI